MRKSLGNKRNKIGDPSEDSREPDHIAAITRIHGTFQDGEERTFTVDGQEKAFTVSKVFDNADFGFHKITVERPLRLNFQASPERLRLLESEKAFLSLASSRKKNEKARQKEIESGKGRQEEIRQLLQAFVDTHGEKLYKDRKAFQRDLRDIDRERETRLKAAEIKAVLNALGERDESAEICRDRQGRREPDPELRDTENVPLKESVEEFFEREVLPHVPDAWIDHSKTKVGYEIPLNRHFYRYEPPRQLEEIEADIKQLEGEILELLGEVTA